jgi:cell wall-associated NlpC family hydrolase
VAVALPEGRTGYVARAADEDLARGRQTRSATPAALEATARQFLGVPYLWGGTSAKGFDCSGYAKTIYWLNGVDLPRDADQQAEAGQPVSLDGGFDALRKGDLLFFVSAPGRQGPITHVAFYLGGGEYLHASGMVKRNSLDPRSPVYSESLVKRLVKARRFVGE